MVIGRVVHLEDVAGPGSMAGMTLSMMGCLMVINRIPVHAIIATRAIHLHHMLLNVDLDALFGSVPPAYPAYPSVLSTLTG